MLARLEGYPNCDLAVEGSGCSRNVDILRPEIPEDMRSLRSRRLCCLFLAAAFCLGLLNG